MNSSMMIHDVDSVTTDGVSYSNANAITLTIEGEGGKIELTLFDLPTDAASRLDQALNPRQRTLSEEAIREDERRKIASQLTPTQFPGEYPTYTFF